MEVLDYGEAFPDEDYQKGFSPYSYDFVFASAVDEAALGMTHVHSQRVRIYLMGHDTVRSIYDTIEHESIHAAIGEDEDCDIDQEHWAIQQAMLSPEIFGDLYFSIVNGSIHRPGLTEKKYTALSSRRSS